MSDLIVFVSSLVIQFERISMNYIIFSYLSSFNIWQGCQYAPVTDGLTVKPTTICWCHVIGISSHRS